MARIVPGLALLACLVSGCAHGAKHTSTSPGAGKVSAVQLEPRWVEPSAIGADVSQVSTYELLDRPPAPPGGEDQPRYRALSASDCQCVAAGNSPTANLLEAEQRGALKKDCCRGRCKPSCSDLLRAEALALAALDERNRAAATALKAHYQLIEAHAGKATLNSSLDALDYLLAGIAELKGQGMRASEIEPGSLERRRLNLMEKRTETELSISQLNGQLRQLLGIAPADPAPFWPEADLTVSVEPVDVDLAVSDGLRQRYDLRLLRLLAGRVTSESLGAAEPVLSAVHPALGASPTPTFGSLLFRRHGEESVGTRRKQLSGLLAQREQQAEAEIRQAAETLRLRVEQVSLAKELVMNRGERVRQIEQQIQAAGGAKRFQLGAAKLELHQAESELMHQVIAWKLAEVELRAAQGLLAAECGYGGRCEIRTSH